MLYFKYVKQHFDYVWFLKNIKEKNVMGNDFLMFGCTIEKTKEN